MSYWLGWIVDALCRKFMACVGHRLQCATINFYISITNNDGLMFFC